MMMKKAFFFAITDTTQHTWEDGTRKGGVEAEKVKKKKSADGWWVTQLATIMLSSARRYSPTSPWW